MTRKMYRNYNLDMARYLMKIGIFWRSKPMTALRYKTIELNGGLTK